MTIGLLLIVTRTALTSIMKPGTACVAGILNKVPSPNHGAGYTLIVTLVMNPDLTYIC